MQPPRVPPKGPASTCVPGGIPESQLPSTKKKDETKPHPCVPPPRQVPCQGALVPCQGALVPGGSSWQVALTRLSKHRARSSRSLSGSAHVETSVHRISIKVLQTASLKKDVY